MLQAQKPLQVVLMHRQLWDNGIALGADALSSGRGAITIGHSARNESGL